MGCNPGPRGTPPDLRRRGHAAGLRQGPPHHRVLAGVAPSQTACSWLIVPQGNIDCYGGARTQAQNVATAGAIPLLVGLMDHPQPELRKEGMIALLSIVMLDAARLAMHDAGLIPVLVRLLEDPNVETREWAAKVCPWGSYYRTVEWMHARVSYSKEALTLNTLPGTLATGTERPWHARGLQSPHHQRGGPGCSHSAPGGQSRQQGHHRRCCRSRNRPAGQCSVPCFSCSFLHAFPCRPSGI